MIKQYLTGNIDILEKVNSWEAGIIKASEVLIKNRIISEQYVHAMIDSVNKNGSYMVIIPQIALAHARPDKGVLATGMSMLKLNQPVIFPEEKPVKIIIVLAAKQDEKHLSIMSELADLFVNKTMIEKMKSANSIEYLEKLIS